MVDIDTKLLRSFLSVATEKSFSTAATRLGCSQGTMSVRIRTLERGLGQRLFDRGRHNLKLTAAGEELLPHARTLVDMHDRLVDRAAARLVSGHVRLGVGEGHGMPFLSRLRQRMREGYSSIHLEIVCGSGCAIAKRTRAGALDLAIVTLPQAERPATLLSRPRLHWVASPDFAFDKNAPLPLACYPEGSFLHEAGISALERRNLAWRMALCSASEELILDAVGAGTAITVMTEGTVPAEMKVVVRPSVLPSLGRACIQLLENADGQSKATEAVRSEVVSAYFGE